MSQIDPRDLGQALEKPLRKFRASSDKRMARRNAADAPRGPLFHYTSQNAFESIITSEQFWYTSIYHMDDTEELNFGFDVCRSLLQTNLERADKAERLFIEPLIETGFREEIRSVVEFYSISFGTRDDQKQWARYGDKCKGVAFGLSVDFFQPLALENPKPDELIFFGKVAYGEKSAKAKHSPIIQSTLDFIKREHLAGSIPEGRIAQALFRRLLAEMYVEVLWNCVTSKSDDWRHQNETRLLVLNRLKDPHLTVSNDRDRPYVKIPQPTLKRSLREVMVGPAADEGAEDNVRAILTKQNLGGIPVTRSAGT